MDRKETTPNSSADMTVVIVNYTSTQILLNNAFSCRITTTENSSKVNMLILQLKGLAAVKCRGSVTPPAFRCYWRWLWKSLFIDDDMFIDKDSQKPLPSSKRDNRLTGHWRLITDYLPRGINQTNVFRLGSLSCSKDSSSSSSAFPSCISGVHHFWWDFYDCDHFLMFQWFHCALLLSTC